MPGTSGNDRLEGGPGSDLLEGLGGHDILIGHGGTDTTDGGPGDDSHFVESAGDVVVERAGEGHDVVYASTSYSLTPGAHVEVLLAEFPSSTAAIDLEGNEFNNAIYGSAGPNTLRGGGGVDVMFGFAGDDFYFTDHAGDLVIEAEGQGHDVVYATADFILTGGSHVEVLLALFQASSAPINLTGNELNNIIYGSVGNNSLTGGGGADVMIGFAGDDFYFTDNVGDIVGESANEGHDVVFATADFILTGGSHVEVLLAQFQSSSAPINLTGNEFNNAIYGSVGANVLTGGGGVDVMFGYAGDDVYFTDNPGDLAIEAANEGHDVVYATADFTLTGGSHVEILLAQFQSSTAAINLTGNELNNVIYGSVGANVLSGGAGSDIMFGFAGDDTYLVDNFGDVVVEAANEGNDIVFAASSYALASGSHIEVMLAQFQSSAAALDLTGNEFANAIYGSVGANSIDGGGGADVMFGYAGDDHYFVDQAGDVAIEAAGEGNDTVWASSDYALAAGSHVETLRARDPGGTAPYSLSGNEFANTVHGNAGANVLDGRGGADTMMGFGGDDTYHVDNAGDVANEAGGGGTDRVLTSVSYALMAGSQIEQLAAADAAGTSALTLTGNEFHNTITGNAGANVIDGKGGIDTLVGLGGADSFAFTTALDGINNVDTVSGFEVGVDRILLGGAAGEAFAALATGNLGPGAFRIGSAAADADDRIIYDGATGALLYDADGSGSGAAVRFATLSTGLNLTEASFAVSGADNRPTVITSGTAANVLENSAVSTIVYQVVASDPDGDTIVYSLGGADAAKFTIDAAGAVRLKAPADFETQQTYNLIVTAADSAGAGEARAVTVTVGDVSESLPAYNIADQETNDTSGAAQLVDRGRMTPNSHVNVPNSSLPSATITGTVAASGDKDFFSITLQAGELLILDVDGTDTLDAELRVFGPDGTLIALNDDPGSFDSGSTAHAGLSHNMDSFIRVRAPTTGTYTFSIQSFVESDGRTSSGGYTLHVVVGPPATRAQIDEENIQAMLAGPTWPSLSLTYGFPTAGSDFGPGEGTDEIAAGMVVLNPTQQNAVQTIVGQIANVTNLTFTQLTASPGGAQLRFAMSSDPKTAHAYEPGPGNGGDSWYNKTSYLNPTVGNYAWLTFIHETGHALGLKHGHESPALSPDRDSMEFSVMTYRSFIGASIDEGAGFRNETFGYAQTLMMYDIAGLQRMYGADFGHNAGDTVYSWNPGSGAFMVNGAVQWIPGANRVFMTTWDGGGSDTYDLSAYESGVKIDLRPGEWTTTSSIQLVNLGLGTMARGNVANSLLYNNDPRSLIENGVGGVGNDSFVPNQAINRFTSGGGFDTFRLMAADDSRPGSADTFVDFTDGVDKIDLSFLDGNTNVSGQQRFDFIGTAAFTADANRASGQVRYETIGNEVHVFGDVNGDGVADFELIVSGLTAVDASDFLLGV